MLNVNFMADGQVNYACLCVGFMTRRHLYVNIQNSTDQTMYLRVKKTDTYAQDCHSAIDFDCYRCIDVSEQAGLSDEHLQVLEDEQIIEKVNEVVKWYNKGLKRLLAS